MMTKNDHNDLGQVWSDFSETRTRTCVRPSHACAERSGSPPTSFALARSRQSASSSIYFRHRSSSPWSTPREGCRARLGETPSLPHRQLAPPFLVPHPRSTSRIPHAQNACSPPSTPATTPSHSNLAVSQRPSRGNVRASACRTQSLGRRGEKDAHLKVGVHERDRRFEFRTQSKDRMTIPGRTRAETFGRLLSDSTRRPAAPPPDRSLSFIRQL
ncbi:hypothetical protein OF83DRAFT_678531 [Amylostereum chailletii]|nr:hypothetical protein OF83DRAFT_678531 [Amylostereum chailletii]